jgi:integrase
MVDLANKTGLPREVRVVVLNDVAQRIMDELRGQHPTYVFTWEDRKGRRRRFCRLNNSGWNAARRRAAARYQQELGRRAPDGFRWVRVHDLKPTCRRRLRAAGVSLEDRQDILAHKRGSHHDPLQCSGDREPGRGGKIG